MNIKTLFTVTAVISVFYAISLFFMPAQYLEMRGLKADEVGTFMTRLLGMAAVALMCFGWYSRNLQNQSDIRGMAISFCATFAAGTIVLLMGKLSISTMTAMGWADVGVSSILFLLYAYFLVQSPKT